MGSSCGVESDGVNCAESSDLFGRGVDAFFGPFLEWMGHVNGAVALRATLRERIAEAAGYPGFQLYQIVGNGNATEVACQAMKVGCA